MSWSYDVMQLQTSPLYQTRFYIGDTGTGRQLVQDEEIAFLLSHKPNPRLAAADACDGIAARFSQEADASAGDLSVSASQKATAFTARATQLRRSTAAFALPAFGGQSIAGKEELLVDPDLVQPSFKIGEDEYPGLPKGEAPGVIPWWR